MTQSDQEEVGTWRWGRLKAAAMLGVAALVALLVFTQVSISHPNARAAAAETACTSYVTGNKPITTGDATVVDAYPTTAGNLDTWLLNFDPMGEGSFYRSIPRNEDVTACVLKGKWELPSPSDLGPGVVHYAVVMIAPDGAATPLMFGPSKFVNEAPPAV
jgi:hypothetical protein